MSGRANEVGVTNSSYVSAPPYYGPEENPEPRGSLVRACGDSLLAGIDVGLGEEGY